MNVYTTDKIRNVVLLGHGGCGKTSLVEAMAYLAGMTTRMGKVADGNTISDYDKEETKRLFSINTSVIPIIWEPTETQYSRFYQIPILRLRVRLLADLRRRDLSVR